MPSRPLPAIPEGEINWRLINQLSLNYRTLSECGSEETTSFWRPCCLPISRRATPIAKHAQSILSVSMKPTTRRLPGSGPLTLAGESLSM